MTTTASRDTTTAPRGGVKPRERASDLAVDLVGRQGKWQLDEQQLEA
jgi:hypothetical protein